MMVQAMFKPGTAVWSGLAGEPLWLASPAARAVDLATGASHPGWRAGLGGVVQAGQAGLAILASPHLYKS